MNNNQIKSVLCIARHGSVAKAAEELFLSRQALLKQLNSLEQELGFRIFERNSSGSILTEEGQIFVNGIKKLNDQYSRLVEKCQNKSGITIRIPYGLIGSLNEIINEFSLTYPDVRIKYVSDYGDDRFEAVNQGVVDILCTFWYEEESKLADYFPLEQLDYVCLVANHHPFANKEFVTLDDLKEMEMVVGKRDFHGLQKELKECRFVNAIDLERLNVINACYAGKVLITHHGFFDKTLKEIPIQPKISKTFGFITSKKKTKAVDNFCRITVEHGCNQ